MGWESSAAYYRIMNRQTRARLGEWHSSRIILDSLEFNAIAQAQHRDDYRYVRAALVESGKRLELAGAEGLVIACNTAHRFAQSVSDAIKIPLLHISDSAGEALLRDGHTKVGLVGTQATMHGTFYRKRLRERFEIDVVVPDKKTRRSLHTMILNELAAGSSPEACAPRLNDIAAGLQAEGATAVLLACTEFGLAYGSKDRPIIKQSIPLYDTAVLHAHAAVSFALDD